MSGYFRFGEFTFLEQDSNLSLALSCDPHASKSGVMSKLLYLFGKPFGGPKFCIQNKLYSKRVTFLVSGCWEGPMIN